MMIGKAIVRDPSEKKSLNGLKYHKGQTWNCAARVIGKSEEKAGR